MNAPESARPPSGPKDGRDECSLPPAPPAIVATAEPFQSLMGGTFFALTLSNAAPRTSEEEHCIRERNPRLRVNFYIGDVGVLAIGNDPLRHVMHSDVAIDVCDSLKSPDCRLSLGYPSATDARHALQNGNRIAGFFDNSEIIVRIEDHDIPMLCVDRAALQALLHRYQCALDMADAYAATHGGKVSVLPLGDGGLTIAKMLSELHRVDRANRSGAEEIKRSQQYLHSGLYFSSPAGTRFKTLGTLEQEILFPSDTCPARYSDRPRCLEYLSSLLEDTDPKRVNIAGRREAQLLMLHPSSETLIQGEGGHCPIHSKVASFVAGLRERFPTSAEWREGLETVRGTIERFIEELRSKCHPVAIYDDLTNPEYVRVVSNLLHGKIDRLQLGESFHTPEVALDVGRFEVAEDGTRRFRVRSDLSGDVKQILDKVIELYPEADQADWLCVLKPQIPLTDDQHPAKFVRSFGDTEDDSYVVLFGRAGEKEKQVVIRKDAFTVYSWRSRASERVEGLLQEFSPAELSQFVHIFKNLQGPLFNHLLQLCSNDRALSVPLFHLHDDYEVRDLIGGKYPSHLDKSTLGFDLTKRILHLLGPICVTNFLAQRPTLSFRELLVTGLNGQANAVTLRTIGVSESFCHPLALKRNTHDYTEEVAILYGAHVASWIYSFLSGDAALKLSAEERRLYTKELLETWASSFAESYISAVSAMPDLDDVHDAYLDLKRRLASSDRELPFEFDLLRYLPLTENLLKRDASDIAGITELFILNAQAMLRKYDLLMEGASPTTSSRTRELFNSAIYSLVSTHFATPRWRRIEKLLDGRLLSFAKFTLHERTQLLSLADVSAWLTQISDTDHVRREMASQLMRAALDHNTTFEVFLHKVRDLRPAVYLSHSSSERFYEAIRELYATWLADEGEESSEQLRNAVARVSGRLFRFRRDR